MNKSKNNLKLFAGAILATFCSLNNSFATEPAPANNGVEKEPIQQEIEKVNTQTEKKPSVITPYGGFGIDKELHIKEKKKTSLDVNASAYLGMKTEFDIDLVKKPVTGDIKLKFSKDLFRPRHKLTFKKAYVKLCSFKIGIDNTAFLPSSYYTTAQFYWNRKFSDNISNSIGIESSNNETIFTESKKWEGVDDIVIWDNQPSGRVLKAEGLKDTGWVPMALVEKMKLEMGMVDTSLALIGKPIIFHRTEEKDKKIDFAFAGGFALDFNLKPVQDMTEISLRIAAGRGIGSHLINGSKYESEIVVRDQKEKNKNQLIVPWGYSAYAGITQYISPKKTSVSLGYSLDSGGVEIGKMFASHKKANKADDEGFTAQDNGWKRFHKLNGGFNWDINGDERIEFSIGVNYFVAQKDYPVSVESSFKVNFL